jgi:hypothetical protein
MVMFTRVRGFFVAVAIGALRLGHAALAPLPMAIVGITHPPDVLEPFDILVMAPARFTFADPIGQH